MKSEGKKGDEEISKERREKLRKGEEGVGKEREEVTGGSQHGRNGGGRKVRGVKRGAG